MYTDHLKDKVIAKSKNTCVSTYNTDVDVSIRLSNEMISHLDCNLGDSILFPMVKYGAFPYSILSNLKNRYEIGLFNEKDTLRLIISNFTFCGAQDHFQFLKRWFNDSIKNQSYQSEIISDFYKQISSIFIYNKEYLDSLNSTILQFFSKENKSSFKIIEKNIQILMNSEIYKNWISRCFNMIDKYTGVSEICSKTFGEVFTPEILIKEMISLLPKAHKNMKFLDPASGTSNFAISLIEKLMSDLEDEILDEEERKKWIIEEMIVQCELQVKNAFISYYILDSENKYDLKIFRGSFLSDDFKTLNPDFISSCKKWDIKSFDYIICNPPYQVDGASGDNKLYLDFTKNSISLLKEKGKLLFITPKGILDYLCQIDKNRNYIDKFYKIEYLAIDTPKKHFSGVGSTFCYFLLSKETVVEDSYKTNCKYLMNDLEVESQITITKGSKLPTILDEKIFSIIDKIKSKYKPFDIQKMSYINGRKETFRRIRKKEFTTGAITTEQTQTHIYPIIEVIKKEKPFPGQFYFFDKKMKDFDTLKIVMSGKGYLCPSLCRGGYNLSDSMLYINIDKENQFDSFLSIINSKISNFVKMTLCSDNGFSNIKIFDIIGGLDLNKIWSNDELYMYYNFSEEEIEIIKKIIKD